MKKEKVRVCQCRERQRVQHVYERKAVFIYLFEMSILYGQTVIKTRRKSKRLAFEKRNLK